jgi:hypothetical protein
MDITKTDFSVDADALRAARIFQADKRELRYYLQATYITENGTIVATDGRTLIKIISTDSPAVTDLKCEALIRINGKIPRKASRVNFCGGFEYGGICWFTGEHGKPLQDIQGIKTRSFQKLEGKYVDYEGVMPEGDPTPTESIILNPAFLRKAEKAANILRRDWPGLELRLRGNDKAAEALIEGPGHQAVVLIMPMAD